MFVDAKAPVEKQTESVVASQTPRLIKFNNKTSGRWKVGDYSY